MLREWRTEKDEGLSRRENLFLKASVKFHGRTPCTLQAEQSRVEGGRGWAVGRAGGLGWGKGSGGGKAEIKEVRTEARQL